MKKMTKILLLSTLTATMATAGAVMMNFSPVEALAATDTAKFAMVDGASIRLAAPKGLRFIAEMGANVYNDLTKEEEGVEKKMGMIIVPYDYVNDSTKYSDGVVGNYQNFIKKIDNVFYDSTNAEDEKIYEKDGYYRVNGVITNLYLQNYDRDFVGIAYISETENGKTTYRFTEINEEENVRSSVYVASAAYADYTDSGVRAIFDEYVMGAHLASMGVTETVTVENGVRNVTYSYDGQTFTSMETVKEATQASFAMNMSSDYVRVPKDGTANITATITDRGTPVNVDTNITWESSNTNVVAVNEKGKLTYKGEGEAIVTATFMGMSASCYVTTGNASISFESGVVPGFMKEAHNAGALGVSDATATDGANTLAIPVTGGAPSLKVTMAFLDEMFADPNVDCIAFDAKTLQTETGNFRRYTLRTTGALGNECYEIDQQAYNCGIKTTWKTFYFLRSDYNVWKENDLETKGSNYFIITGNFTTGDTLYVDNIRPATRNDMYGFEGGGLRWRGAADNYVAYCYTPTYIGNWSLALTGGVLTDVQWTNEIVSSGRRALQFTKNAGETNVYIPKQRMMLEDVNKTGYMAIDLYVPADADTTLTMANAASNYATNPLMKGSWNTLYIRVDAGAETPLKIKDTTGGTYVIDHIRSVSETEYNEAVLGFEISGGGLRTNELPGIFRYYGGLDHARNTFTFTASAGNGVELKNVRFDTNIVHSGNYSLAFEKNNGYLAFSMKVDSAFGYPTLKNGFTFWMYSTVGINGKSTTNFINGYNKKFGDNQEGISISANKWTQITIKASDINESGRFLIMQGSTGGTIYFDDIRPL